jgi:hypothetical protein
VHEVTGEEKLCPEKATVLGPCKVIGQEYPQITCGSIDIVLPTADPQAIRDLSTLLIAEMTPQDAQFHEPMVAYRGKQRWVQTFEPLHLESQTGFTARLREGGIYLITGGLGSAGRLPSTAGTGQIDSRRTFNVPSHK